MGVMYITNPITTAVLTGKTMLQVSSDCRFGELMYTNTVKPPMARTIADINENLTTTPHLAIWICSGQQPSNIPVDNVRDER